MARRLHRCPFGTCAWTPSPRGAFEVCTACGDRFPCAKSCDHEDCKESRGEPSLFDKYNPDKIATAKQQLGLFGADKATS